MIRARLDREGVAALLAARPDVAVAGHAETQPDAVALRSRLRPRVAILDPLVAWSGSRTLVSDILAASPRTRILVLAPHDADRCALLNPPGEGEEPAGRALAGASNCLSQALREGAHGVLRRDCGAAELARAVRALAEGGQWVGADVSLREPEGLPLSQREREVARLVGRGCSNKEIAGALEISELTVRKHVSEILAKLGLHGRLQLGLCVARHSTRFADLVELA